MRFALWLIGLFAVAAALALFAGSDPGTVTVFWPPYRVDLSLNLTLLLLFVAFALLYFAVRALRALFRMPRQAERWRMQRLERALHAWLLDAWGALNAGRVTHAGTAAQALLKQLSALPTPTAGSMAGGEAEELAWQRWRLHTACHWLVAQSEQRKGDAAAHDRQLTALRAGAETVPSATDADDVATGAAAAADWRDAALLAAAQTALQEHRPALADGLLDQLSARAARRVQARHLRLGAASAEGRTLDALRRARQLARRGLLPTTMQAHRCRLALAHVAAAGDDANRLRKAWDELDAAERAWPLVAAAAADRLCGHDSDGAHARRWLLPAWQQSVACHAESSVDLQLPLVRALLRTLALPAAGPPVRLDDAWQTLLTAAVESGNEAAAHDMLRQLPARAAELVLALDCGDTDAARQLLADPARRLPDSACECLGWRALAHRLDRSGDRAAAERAWRRAAQAV